jgi:hypothetical protein
LYFPFPSLTRTNSAYPANLDSVDSDPVYLSHSKAQGLLWARVGWTQGLPNSVRTLSSYLLILLAMCLDHHLWSFHSPVE